MGKYRKEDSYYEDQYDRATIEILKKLEQKSKKPIEKIPVNIIDKDLKDKFIVEPQYDPFNPFYVKAVHRAQDRTESILIAKQKDDNKDRLVMYNLMPQMIKCHTCNCRMSFCGHHFINNDTEILFVFECPKNHKPKKVLYPNGHEYYFKKTTCTVCGSIDIDSTSKKNKKTLFYEDKCNDCGHIEKYSFDLTFTPDLPITEEDRKKYCTYFIGRKTFIQDLQAVSEYMEHYKIYEKEREARERYKVEEIEKINLPQLEELLVKLTEEHRFNKLQFKPPDLGRHVTVEFSIQDSSNRTERESKKLFAKTIQERLIKTNWRLVNPDNISYRLGVLSGKLKAYETEDDLLMLAKHIAKKLK